MTTTEFEPLPDLATAEPSAGTLVMKFGGTSVADPEKIKDVARRLVEMQAAGNRVVAVLSAMGDSTDDLVRLAYEVSARPKPRELDMLISVGERISCALAAMAIHDLGAEAISLTGSQAGIVTDTVHGRAKSVDVRARRIHEALDQDRIVLVAGFQGVSTDFDITTLGRGGSDTTAVALAAALGAEVCEIYTDVEGVFTADPRLVPEARKLHAVSFEEMLELAASGAKVLQVRSVEIARSHHVKLHVRPSYSPADGTWIREEDERMLEKALISGITHTREETLYRVEGTTAAQLFAALAEALHRLGAGTRDRLVRREPDARQADRVVQRLQHARERDRAAIRVGDDPLVLEGPLAVHLGHDQRDAVLQAEGLGLVDADRAATHRVRDELAARAGADREEAEVEVACRERLGRGLFDHTAVELAPGRAG